MTKALLLVRPPDGAPHVTVTAGPATLSDIGPTLLDYTGLPHQDFDGHSLRPDIQGPKRRHLAPSIGHLMYDKEAWGVVLNNHKYIIETVSGRQMLFDLGTDPGEQNNLAADADLAPYVRALSMSHQMPAGPGWRIQVPKSTEPFTVDLPAPAIAAGILDPEAGRSRRANLAWGERANLLEPMLAEWNCRQTNHTNNHSIRTRVGQVLPTYCSRPAHLTAILRRHSGWNRLNPTTPRSRTNERKSGTVRADDMELLKALGYVSPWRSDQKHCPL